MNVYKNDLDETVRFRIEPHIGTEGIYLELQENGKRATTVFPPKDAPALALAVLEAAGVEKKLHRRFEFELGSPGHLKAITYELDLYIREEIERATEAKEQAELEAEALELFNISQGTNLGAWAPRTDRSVINIWVEIAKRAREIAGRAEK